MCVPLLPRVRIKFGARSKHQSRWYLSLILIMVIAIIFVIKSFNHPDDFSTGILALNLPQSSYSVGESILFHMASLDSKGKTLCDSKLQLQITNNKFVFFNHVIKTLTPVVTSTCGQADTAEPDYITRFTPEKPGKYTLTLTNLDSKKKIHINLNISAKKSDFIVERWSPTRINPNIERYPMVIKITASKDFNGEIIETLPDGFKIIWQGNAKLLKNSISWSVDLKKGQTINLPYDFSYSGASPNLIKINSVKISGASSDAPWSLAYAQ